MQVLFASTVTNKVQNRMSTKTAKRFKFYKKMVMDIAEIDDFMLDNDFVTLDGRYMWGELADLITDRDGKVGISRQLLHGHAQKKAYIARCNGALRIIPNRLISEAEGGVA